MSYLLFTSKYTRELVEIGYHDAGERIDEIEDFLYTSNDGDAEDAPSRWLVRDPASRLTLSVELARFHRLVLGLASFCRLRPRIAAMIHRTIQLPFPLSRDLLATPPY